MAVTDFRPQAPRGNFGASKNFSNSIGSLGDSIANLQTRELARNQDARLDSRLVLDQNRDARQAERQTADLVEEQRKRDIQAGVNKAIISTQEADLRKGFTDRATSFINEEAGKQLEALNKKREFEMSKLPGNGSKFDAMGNPIDSPEKILNEEKYRTQRDAIQLDYDNSVNEINNRLVSAYESTSQDYEAQGRDAYQGVLQAGGSIEQATNASKQFTDRSNFTDAEKEQLKQIDSAEKIALDTADLYKIEKQAEAGTGFKSNSSTKNKKYLGGEGPSKPLTAPSTKDRTKLFKDFQDNYPDDLFTIFKKEAKDAPNVISKAMNRAVEINGSDGSSHKIYPTMNMIKNAMVEATDPEGWFTEQSLDGDKYKNAIEKAVLANMQAYKNRAYKGNNSSSLKTKGVANPKEMQLKRKVIIDRANAERNALVGDRNKQFNLDDARSLFKKEPADRQVKEQSENKKPKEQAEEQAKIKKAAADKKQEKPKKTKTEEQKYKEERQLNTIKRVRLSSQVRSIERDINRLEKQLDKLKSNKRYTRIGGDRRLSDSYIDDINKAKGNIAQKRSLLERITKKRNALNK